MTALADRFARCGTLADAIRVGLAQRPALMVLAVVVQDEYTHDVVMGPAGATPGSPGTFVLLDAT